MRKSKATAVLLPFAHALLLVACSSQDSAPTSTDSGDDLRRSFRDAGSDVGVCAPKTCIDLGASCGTVSDGCGGMLDCGSCVAPETCGGGGTPNACGALDASADGGSTTTWNGPSYYVTQSGSGNHDGSSAANAWSVAEFNASSVPTGGAAVFFSGSITSTVAPATGGTGNGASRLKLDFTAATLSTADPRIVIRGLNFLDVVGGTLAEASSGTLISFDGTEVHDVTITRWTHTGTSTSTAQFVDGTFASNLVLSENSVDNVAGFIIDYTSAAHDITLLNNYVRTSLNTSVQTDIVFIADAANVTIQGNKLVNRAPGSQMNSRHNDVIQTFESGASTHQPPANWTIRYNWIEENVGSGGDGSNSWTMLENMNGTNKIYSNVFVGGGTEFATNGMDFNNCYASVVVYLYNNTFIGHGTPGNAVRFQNSGTLYARNNLGELDATPPGTYLAWSWTAGGQWNRNFFYDFDDCSGTYTGPNGSCTTNPLFVDYTGNDFALQASSALINAGDGTIGAEYDQGIAAGATWPNPSLTTRATGAWDVGAYQMTVP